MSTETAVKPYRFAATEGLADVWWKSGRCTIKAGPDETGNAFSQLVMDEPRGSATPVHIHHNEDETFYIVEGQVSMFGDEGRIDLEAGDYFFVPRGVVHAYLVRSERARMLVTISPSGTEQLFVSLGVPVTGSEPPTDAVMPPMPELVRLFAAHGTEIIGPPPSLDDLSN
jgi:quercetin dioxygenase-like cupin family protein